MVAIVTISNLSIQKIFTKIHKYCIKFKLLRFLSLILVFWFSHLGVLLLFFSEFKKLKNKIIVSLRHVIVGAWGTWFFKIKFLSLLHKKSWTNRVFKIYKEIYAMALLYQLDRSLPLKLLKNDQFRFNEIARKNSKIGTESLHGIYFHDRKRTFIWFQFLSKRFHSWSLLLKI